MIKQIINDNATNLISKLNKLFYYIMGIQSKAIFAYSPWADGKSESRMKLLNRGVLINNYYRELVGMQDVYHELNEIQNSNKDYHTIIPTIMMCHNSKIQPGTGYTPNELQINNDILNVLDVALK